MLERKYDHYQHWLLLVLTWALGFLSRNGIVVVPLRHLVMLGNSKTCLGPRWAAWITVALELHYQFLIYASSGNMIRGVTNYRDTLHTGARIYTSARACDELTDSRQKDLSARDRRLNLTTKPAMRRAMDILRITNANILLLGTCRRLIIGTTLNISEPRGALKMRWKQLVALPENKL